MRLKTSAQFKNVLGHAQRFNSRYFIVCCRANQHGSLRLGLSIAKKKLKRATDRQGLKRLIREHFRLNQHDFSNVDIVFILKAPLKSVDKQEMRACIEQLWQKLARYYKSS